MKTTILLSMCMLFAYATTGFAQSKADVNTAELAAEHNVQKTDSIYYGCVPCCKACSVFRTDAPGECPHCGMTLEKRSYQTAMVSTEDLAPATNPACEAPKKKKREKGASHN